MESDLPSGEWDMPFGPVVPTATDAASEAPELATEEQTAGEQPAEEQTAGEQPAGEQPPALSIDEVEHLLDEVEAALSRLDDETYGQCSSCGERIDDGLLAQAPTRRTCDACASTPVA